MRSYRAPWFALTALSVSAGIVSACSGEVAPSAATAADAAIDSALMDAATPDACAFEGDAAPEVGVPACTAKQRADRLSAALMSPIVPLVSMYGMRIPVGDDPPLTLAEVETALCPGEAEGDLFGDGSYVVVFGSHADIWAHMDCSLRVLGFSCSGDCPPLAPFHSADMSHAYAGPNFSPLTKDGQPFLLDWSDAAKLDAEMNELYDALRATFAPSMPVLATSCASTTPALCTSKTSGEVGQLDIGQLGFPSLGLTFTVENVAADQPLASTIDKIDIGSPR